jgi:hypothetical protein
MAQDLVSLSYLTTNLASARNPVVPSGYDGADVLDPPSASSGVAISGAMALLVLPALRVDPFRRTAYVLVDTLDLAADYTLTIDGDDVTVTGPFTDLDDLLTTWVTAINADVTVGAKIQADAWTGYDSTGDAVLRVRGKSGTAYHDIVPLTYSVDASATGTAVLSIAADAESATMRLYWRPQHVPTGGAVYDSGARSVAWRIIAASTSTGTAEYAIGPAGLAMRADCAGALRIYAGLSDVAGVAGDGSATYLARVDLTPCVQESTS